MEMPGKAEGVRFSDIVFFDPVSFPVPDASNAPTFVALLLFKSFVLFHFVLTDVVKYCQDFQLSLSAKGHLFPM